VTAQMRAVTVRAAKTNIVIGAILHQPLLASASVSLTNGDCSERRRRDVKRFTPR
jgi:hypothetical protein